MNEVNRFLEEGILQAIRNLLPVKSILRDSLQEEDDDAIHIASPDADTPSVSIAEPVAEPLAEPVAEPVAEPLKEPLKEPVAEPVATPVPGLSVTKLDETLIVDTEKSVGFTGMDSVFGDSGHAELRPMIDEGDEFKILDGSEDLSMNEFEDLNSTDVDDTPIALSVGDYETL